MGPLSIFFRRSGFPGYGRAQVAAPRWSPLEHLEPAAEPWAEGCALCADLGVLEPAGAGE